MAKRIYEVSVKKWALAIGIPSGTAFFALLFLYLATIGAIDITSYSGDIACQGSEESPCFAYINFTAKEDIFIYPIGYDPFGRNSLFYTDEDLKSWKIYRSWGSGWREIDLTSTCKGTWCGGKYGTSKNVYSFAFREGRDYSIKIEALKKDYKQDIKWGFGPIDPVWIGINNSKTYSKQDRTITVKNLDLLIGTINLKSNRCISGKICEAILDVYSEEDYPSAIKDITFDLLRGGQRLRVDLPYQVLIKTGTEVIKKPTYTKVCSQDLVNKSKQNCNSVQSGTRDEVIDTWEEWDGSDLSSKSSNTFKIVVEKGIFDEIDWVATFFDLRSEEFAVFDNPIAFYWNFEDANTTVAFNADNNSINNGSMLAGTDSFGFPIKDTLNGFLNKGVNFTGNTNSETGNFVHVNYNSSEYPLGNLTEYSWSFWVNLSRVDIEYKIMGHPDSPGNSRYLEIDTNNIRFHESTVVSVGSAPSVDLWHFIVVTVKINDLSRIYIDNDNVDNTTFSDPFLANFTNNFSINGYGVAPGQFFNGSLDEFTYWKVALTPADINELWNGGEGLEFKLEPPVINITFPENISYAQETLEFLNYTLVVETDPQACWYSLNNGVSNVTITCGDNVTGLDSSFGQHTWRVYANSTTGEESVNNVTFIAATVPTVTLLINNQTQNLTGELGSKFNITANTTSGIVCVDIDHPDYGINFSCASNIVSFIFNVSYFRNNIFNDSTTSKEVFFRDNQFNQTIYIDAHQYDEIVNLSINLTGSIHNSTLPTGVNIYINNTLSNTLGLITEGDTILDETNNSNTVEELNYTESGTRIVYFNIPKTANVSEARVNLTGNISNFITIDGLGLWTNTIVSTNDCYTADQLVFTHDGNACGAVNGDVLSAFQDVNFSAINSVNFSIGFTSSWPSIGGFQTNWSVSFGGVENYSENISATVSSNVRSVILNTTGQSGIQELRFEVKITSTVPGSEFIINVVPLAHLFSTTEGNQPFTKYQVLNPKLEVGIPNGTLEYEFVGIFNHSKNRTNDFSDSANVFLAGCTADSDGFCQLPLYFTIESKGGRITISDILVNYTAEINPIFLDVSLVSTFLGNSTNFSGIPIKFSSTKNGSLTIDDIRYDFAGGNDTINITVHNPTRETEIKGNILQYFSDWDFNFPRFISFLEFIPKTPTSKNVSAFGQTEANQILNLTFQNYGGKNANMNISLNESNACTNLTLSLDNNISHGFIVNETWKVVVTDVLYQNNTKIWLWADYSCSQSSWSSFVPDILIQNCAEGVDVCDTSVI